MLIPEKSLLIQPYEVSRAAYRCDNPERKLLYFAATRIELKPYEDIKTPRHIATFKISTMLKALGIRNTTSNRQAIKAAVETVASRTITLCNDEGYLDIMNWLQRGIFDDKTDTVTLIFTSEIGNLFLENKERFSLINLKIVGSLKSYFAMRYYEIALSWIGKKGMDGNKPNQWYFDLSKSDIRTMFKIDENSYERQDSFTAKIVKAPIAELNKNNPDFQITIEYIKDGRETLGYRFNCESVPKVKKITPPTKNENAAIREYKRQKAEWENDPLTIKINKMKTEYFNEYLKAAVAIGGKKKNELQAVFDSRVLEALEATGMEF